MKLALAAACLVASLMLAGHALADGRTVATLQTPLATKTKIIVDDAVWACEQNTCVAGATSDGTFSVSECKDLAKHVGRFSDFQDQYHHTLQAAALEKCNASAPVAAPVTASR
ncbi:MAG: CC_3452 family protein [Caulobacterales bacterium]